MKAMRWLTVNRRGSCRIAVGKPGLDYDEVLIKIFMQIPDELFVKPHLEAAITVKDVPATPIPYELVINTKDQIEQAAGVKIDFKVLDTGEDGDTEGKE